MDKQKKKRLSLIIQRNLEKTQIARNLSASFENMWGRKITHMQIARRIFVDVLQLLITACQIIDKIKWFLFKYLKDIGWYQWNDGSRRRA